MVPTKHNESARELALEVVWVFAFHPGLCRKGALSFVWAVRVYPPRFGAIIAHDTMPQRTGTGWHRGTAQVRKLGKIKLASGQCNGKIAGIPLPNQKKGEKLHHPCCCGTSLHRSVSSTPSPKDTGNSMSKLKQPIRDTRKERPT